MAFQTVFKRYELKYLITKAQKEVLIQAMIPHMEPDGYGSSTVRNLYFDTDTYLLIRRSIEKPAYKEKLRLRCYGTAEPGSIVFAELKKKYKSIVYKRRISLPCKEAMEWITGENHCRNHTQISDEVDYFLDYYGPLHPTVFLSYEREAFYSKDSSDFRVTFDDNILVRQKDLSLSVEPYGTPILSEDKVLMEIKCSGGIPLWMTEILSREHIYKTSFSKYGTAYKNLIFPELKHTFEEGFHYDTESV